MATRIATGDNETHLRGARWWKEVGWKHIFAIAVIVMVLHAFPDDADDGDFWDIVWGNLMRTLDPGTMGADAGLGFRLLMLLVTVGGLIIVASLIGIVSGGFDDKSFNQTSYKGMTDAKDQIGIETGQVESTTTADFAKNIKAMVDANCNVIVTVGFLLSDATMEAAKANPDIHFAIVDDNPEGAAEVKNLKPLVFNTAESSFLAGYVAASQSQSGKVGTFGGKKIPTVTIFMDGFAQGVQYFNQQKGKNVQVLGWDAARQDGQFIPGERSFEDLQGGKRTAENLISQGADIIFPVAGPAGEGGLQAAQASGGKVNAIWVDTDGCESASNYCPFL